MPLTVEQQKTVANHLNTRGQSPKCPVCGNSGMSVRSDVTLQPLHDAPDESLTLVSVECKFCAHVLQFNANVFDFDL